MHISLQAPARSFPAGSPHLMRRDGSHPFALPDAPHCPTAQPAELEAIYCSGASAYWDVLGLTAAGRDIGVVANLLQPRVIFRLRQALRQGLRVFCDSGAYSRYQAWQAGQAASPVVDFAAVFAIYDALIHGLPPPFFKRVALVMPDVLHDSAASMALLRQHREKVLSYIALGVQTIVPLQKGPDAAGVTAQATAALLGTDRFTLGIPSAAAAMSAQDLRSIHGMHSFHILGRCAPGPQLTERMQALRANNPGASVSADANQLRSRTAAISREQSRLMRENRSAVWESAFDDTELINDIRIGVGWMTGPQIIALAKFFGQSTAQQAQSWIAAHRTTGLAALIDELDPDGMLLYQIGIPAVFTEAARRHLSARMRAPAVACVLGPAGRGKS